MGCYACSEICPPLFKPGGCAQLTCHTAVVLGHCGELENGANDIEVLSKSPLQRQLGAKINTQLVELCNRGSATRLW